MVKTYPTVYCRRSHSLSEPIPSSPIYRASSNKNSSIGSGGNIRIGKPPLLDLHNACKTNCNTISISISLSSSPVKKLSDRCTKKIELAVGPTLTGDGDSGTGFSLNTSMIPTPEPRREIALVEKVIERTAPKTYVVDSKLNHLLEEFTTKGQFDLGVEDVTYLNHSVIQTTIKIPTKFVKDIEYQLFYTGQNAEAMIGIPNAACALSPNLKSDMMNCMQEIFATCNPSRRRKRKVVILAPRSEASWFQRKLRNVNLQFRKDTTDYEFIQVKFPKHLSNTVEEQLGKMF